MSEMGPFRRLLGRLRLVREALPLLPVSLRRLLRPALLLRGLEVRRLEKIIDTTDAESAGRSGLPAGSLGRPGLVS